MKSSCSHSSFLSSASVLLLVGIFVGLTACEAEFKDHASGLKIRENSTGDSSAPATKMGDILVMHYTGSTEVGGQRVQFFDSRERENPILLPLIAGRIIRGFEIALVDRRPGAQLEVIVPPKLGYGDKGAGIVIPPKATLHFDMEILEVRRPPEFSALDGRTLERDPSGIQYALVEAGTGDLAKKGDYVHLHFARFGADGNLQDTSLYYGEAYELHVGQPEVPRSWNVVLPRMRPGAKARVVVPRRLFSGAEKASKGKDEFISYDLELLKIDSEHDDSAPAPGKADGGHHGHAH